VWVNGGYEEAMRSTCFRHAAASLQGRPTVRVVVKAVMGMGEQGLCGKGAT